MCNKIRKYFLYTVRFSKSENKRDIIKGLRSEIKNKGLITGVRSFLHKKIHGINDDDYDCDFKELFIEEYDVTKTITLPNPVDPKVSIIIPMYNQVQYTCNCIYSIYKNSELTDYEIIVADDNSTEDVAIFRSCFENIIIHRNETNQGFLLNCKLAAKEARGEYIVFLNNDTQVQERWLEELLYIFENFKNVGIAGSRLMYPNGKLQEAGGIVWQDGSAWNYGNGDRPGKPEYCYVRETDYVSGASLMIRRSLWDDIGGFDERFIPAYCEDSDLCFSVRSKGYKVIYQPFSVVVHFEGVSHGTNVEEGIKQYQIINQEKFYDKWCKVLETKSKNGENVFYERGRTTNRRHVLVVDHYLPQIDKDAGSRTISNFIEALLDLNYSITFLGEYEKPLPHYKKYYQEKGVEVLYGNQYQFSQENWMPYLERNLNNFDAILLSRSSVCMPIIRFLRHHDYKGNIIYYGHDLGFLRIASEAEITNDAALYKEAKELKAKEEYMYNNADNSLVCSLDELNYLQKYIIKPLHYTPPYYFDIQKERVSYEDRSGILFVGGFRHSPNQNAMKWFIEDVYEPLDKMGIQLTIAGSEIPGFIFEYKTWFKSLTVLPDVSVEELNNLYEKTRIAIVPLRLGAGVKGKVIEAMAKGVPVVGTDIAFEGMPKEDNFIYKGVNLSADIINEIVHVYTDKDYWEKLSQFGKGYVSNNFNKENLKLAFRNIIESEVTNAK